MTEQWIAEHSVDVALARALVSAQFPDLAAASVEPIGSGWDNTAFLVGDAWVFRFPRRRIAVDCLVREIRLLPTVAPQLPLAVPVPERVGAADARFPWPFAGYRRIAGRTACSLALGDDRRAALATPLAGFLRALHAFPVPQARSVGAPGDELDRLGVRRRRPKAIETLEDLVRLGALAPGDVESLRGILDSLDADAAPIATALVHGDLYVRHLLVDDGGRLTGVIDWGDLHVGDPAVDLAIAHSFLPPTAHAEFVRAYGPIDRRAWSLARFRALYHSATLALYAQRVADADLAREAAQSLQWIAASLRVAPDA